MDTWFETFGFRLGN